MGCGWGSGRWLQLSVRMVVGVGFLGRFGCGAGAAAPCAPALAAGVCGAAVGVWAWFLRVFVLAWVVGVGVGVVVVLGWRRSVATGATTQAPWWLALSRRAGCGGVLRVAGAGRVVCAARHTLQARFLLHHSTLHCRVKSCLVLPLPTAQNGA